MAERVFVVGEQVSIEKVVTEQDIEAFAELSRDRNRIHFDETYAQKTVFGTRIAHGMISAALISGALTQLMGDGNVWLSLNLDFKKPVYIGDQISCALKIVSIERRSIASIEVEVRNSRSELVLQGAVKSMRAGPST